MEELIKKFKKMTTVQLISKVEKSLSEEKDVILFILKNRGQDISKWEPKSENTVSEEELVIRKSKLVSELDQLLDCFAMNGRSKEYDGIVSILGGNEHSIISDLFEDSTLEQLKEALKFKESLKIPCVKIETPKIENKIPVKKDESKNEDDSFQEFPNETVVKFLLKGVENTGEVKKFIYDKTDKCYYYILKLENGKDSYKRPGKLYV